jgi:23S rRNA pseudouridine2605 synthase
MRINKFVAQATGLSRRAADQVIADGQVLVNGMAPPAGHDVIPADRVTYRGKQLALAQTRTIMLNKPAGFVVSRDGQGSDTIYDLLPAEFHSLKPVGRLDKYSSGLLLLTNDGALAQELTHPSYQKSKVYEVILSKALAPLHRQMIQDHGVQLEDGPSSFELERLKDGDDGQWRITMRQGRNRQIRRTFLALGYGISRLHRTHFGDYDLKDLAPKAYQTIT